MAAGSEEYHEVPQDPQDSWSLGRDSNSVPAEYQAVVQSTRQLSSEHALLTRCVVIATESAWRNSVPLVGSDRGQATSRILLTPFDGVLYGAVSR
jgi:hypothetical protein